MIYELPLRPWAHFAIAPLLLTFSKLPVLAQATPDGTLGAESSIVSSPGPDVVRIDGGARRGGNLFHSFSEFSVPTGGEASFNNAAGVENILTRVTGSHISNIDGLLRANGTANLLLLNPNGLVFGANARLDIGGSFLGTTADRIFFEGDGTFGVAGDLGSALLTVSTPVGLQFSGERVATIRANGPGNVQKFNGTATERVLGPEGLMVAPNRAIALVGGEVVLGGGTLRAPAGNVQVAGVREGTVGFALERDAFLDIDGVAAFGDLLLENAAAIDTSGEGYSNVGAYGRSILLTDGSIVFVRPFGGTATEPSGALRAIATETIELSGTNPLDGESSVAIGGTLSAVPGSDIAIETRELVLREGGLFSSITFASGDAGDITVRAEERVAIAGTGRQFASSLLSDARVGSGNAGDIAIETRELRLTGGSNISSSALTTGNAGNIRIRADRVEVAGAGPTGASTLIAARVEPGGVGLGGILQLHVGELLVRDGATVSTETRGRGRGGNIDIVADTLISNDGRISADTFNTGAGGNIDIEADRIVLLDGGVFSSRVAGNGNGGSISVRASEIEASGVQLDENVPIAMRTPSGILSQVEPAGTGSGGAVTVEAESLALSNGAQFTTASTGPGDAGALTVRAKTIDLSGTFPERGRTALVANTTDPQGTSTGAGGNIFVVADTIVVRDGAIVTASNFQTLEQLNPGRGPAGSIRLEAREILLDGEAAIVAEAAAGGEGNITLFSSSLQLRRTSQIATDSRGAATGGNIAIATDTLVALENSDITANALLSQGGRVVIDATGIFGTQFRSSVTPQSDITASSELGASFAGVVEIEQPEVDPGNALVDLSVTFLDAVGELDRDPCKNISQNQFVVTGRSGLPRTPFDWQVRHSRSEWAAFPGVEAATETTREALSRPSPREIAEATHWQIDRNGNVELLAIAPIDLRHGHQNARCNVAGRG